MKLSKMQIVVVDDKGKFESNNLYTEQEVLYNPTTMSYSKSINWSDANTRGGNIKKKQYDQVGDHKLQVDLLFDFTMLPKHTFEYWFVYFQALSSETIKESSEQSKRPPILSINWGGSPYIHFSSCVITQIDWSYELFDYEGNVLRAMAKVSFQEISLDGKKECVPTIKKVEAKEVEDIREVVIEKKKEAEKKKKEAEKEAEEKKEKVEEEAEEKKEKVEEESEEKKEEVEEEADGFFDKIDKIVNAADDKISKGVDKIEETYNNLAKEHVDSATEKVERAEKSFDNAKEKVDNRADQVKEKSEEVTEKVEEMKEKIAEPKEKLEETKEKISEAKEEVSKAKESIKSLKDEF